MRFTLTICGVVLFSLGCAMAQNPPATAPSAAAADRPAAGQTLTPDSSVDQILDALHEVGRDLKDFTADVRLMEKDLIAQDSSTRGGKVFYQKKADGDARLRVVFDTRTVGQAAQQEKLEYLLDNGWLVERNYRRQIQTRRQVLRPGEKINLLKLGEGPFPLPIGQEKQDVQRLFDVKKIAFAKDDPAGTIHVQLTPKADTQFERKFSQIDVWVEPQTHFPRRIQTMDKNQTALRTTDLESIQVNRGVKDADFALPPIKTGEWTLRDEPYAE